MRNSVLILCALLWSINAAAHGVADNHLQIMVVEGLVKMNITVDMRVLQKADENGDGYASLAELREHGDYLRSWIRKSLDVTNENGDTGEVIFADVTSDLNIARDHGDRVDHARILQSLKFDTAPQALHVNLAAFAALIPEFRVTIIDASTGSRYRLSDPMLSQSVPMPQRAGG